MAYRAAGGAERRQLTWFDRTGKNVGVAGEPDANDLLAPELSPDGRHIAVDRTVQNNRDVWLMDLVRGGFTRLTFDAAGEAIPSGRRTGHGSRLPQSGKASLDIWIKPASGTGTEELLLETPKHECAARLVKRWPVPALQPG